MGPIVRTSPGITPPSYELVAANHARTSDNAIHDDPVATAYGFRGGLVPGVDVFAYLVHPAVVLWGLDWVASGAIEATFRRPVYDGAHIEVATERTSLDTLALELTDAEGEVCATAMALRSHADAPVRIDDVAVGDRAEAGLPASAESLAVGTALVPIEVGFHASRTGAYLDEVDEHLEVFRNGAIAHPGWLLRFANFVLAEHVRLGPWIHTGSKVQMHGLVHDGARVEVRAVVSDEYERRGHRYVELDVCTFADGDLVQRAAHTAIHTLRPPEETT